MQLSAHVLVWNVCVEFQSLEAEGHRIVPIIFFRGQIDFLVHGNVHKLALLRARVIILRPDKVKTPGLHT